MTDYATAFHPQQGPETGAVIQRRSRTPVIPAVWLVTALAISALAVTILMIRTGLIVASENRGFAVVAISTLTLASVRFRFRRAASRLHMRLRDFAEDFLLFMTTCLLGVLASYPAAAATTGFADPSLEHMDRVLHFDWLAWYRAVSEYPLLQNAGAVAYAAIYVTPILLLGYFAFTHNRADARRFLMTFWVAAVLTLLLFPLFPAEGPLAFLWHGPIPYMPTSALYQEQLIPALRTHAVTHIDLGALRGLVCAPSFHTASAVVFMATAWPVARLRWPLVAINVAMLFSTPIEGTHYLSDMIVGGLVAVVAILLTRAGLHFWGRQQGHWPEAAQLVC